MPTPHNSWVVIGISGVTCGGKTSLANRLKAALSPVKVFHQDQYFYPDDSPKHVKCDGLEHNNYDILSALDMEAMLAHVRQALAASDPHVIDPHVNDPHASDSHKFTLPGKKFLIVEGFTVLNYKPIMELCDLRYYFVLEYGECMLRRSMRLYDPPDIAGYFEQCVWPEHIKYRAEIEQDKRVKILDGTQPDVFDIVLADLRAIRT